MPSRVRTKPAATYHFQHIYLIKLYKSAKPIHDPIPHRCERWKIELELELEPKWQRREKNTKQEQKNIDRMREKAHTKGKKCEVKSP